MLKAEFCYAPPSISPLYVSNTASFSTGIQPGTTSWSFFKTAQLAPPYLNNMASMFKGDTAVRWGMPASAMLPGACKAAERALTAARMAACPCCTCAQDVTWTLSVQKTGTDTVYQGAVSGQVTISNPQNVPVTIYSVNGYVQGGPSATVSCGAPVPMTVRALAAAALQQRWQAGLCCHQHVLAFGVDAAAVHTRTQIQPCSSAMCSYVAYWPVSPTAGTYTGVADVTYSVGDTNVQGNQVGTSIFQVGTISDSVGMISTIAGNVASGQAVIQDSMAPQQFTFSGAQRCSCLCIPLCCSCTALKVRAARC